MGFQDIITFDNDYDISMTQGDSIFFIFNGSATKTINLPQIAGGYDNLCYSFFNACSSSYVLNVVAYNGDNIKGASVSLQNNEYVNLVSYNGYWYRN